MTKKINNSVITEFNISDYEFIVDGGQKRVFKVVISGVNYILKSYPGLFTNRDKQEYSIYNTFAYIDNIPKILQIVDIDNKHYVLEEFIDGHTLKELKDKFLGDNEKTKKIILDLLLILKDFWDKSIVHRDIKPANVMLKENGKVFLIDFGIARNLLCENITITGDLQPKTLPFSSPEQIFNKRDEISYLSDLFCLGILGYYLLYGKHPVDWIESIENGTLELNLDNSIPINNFINSVLKVKPYERESNYHSLINLLSN